MRPRRWGNSWGIRAVSWLLVRRNKYGAADRKSAVLLFRERRHGAGAVWSAVEVPSHAMRRRFYLPLVASVIACGNGAVSSDAGSHACPTSVYCLLQGEHPASCRIDTYLNPSDVPNSQKGCTSNAGSLVDACPVQGLVGCCSGANGTPGHEFGYEGCTYSDAADIDAFSLEVQCASGGDYWTDGIAALSDCD